MNSFYNYYWTVFNDTDGLHRKIHVTLDDDEAEDFAQKIEEYWCNKDQNGNVQVWEYKLIKRRSR